ncbi:MAG: SPFH domain-containing protein [Bacteroidales bacterium]|nr:SPFH domain-containing protein [Bacteroidales bacterium]
MEKEFKGIVLNGFMMLFVTLLMCFGGIALTIVAGMEIVPLWMVGFGIASFIISFFLMPGFVMLEPNEAKVMVFFGKYEGTFARTGYFWVNPFLSKKTVSLRARNLNIDPIKVNDKEGNPILIGLVLVWKLKDSYKAMFEIDSQTLAAASTSAQVATSQVASRMRAFENFVKVQSDAALRSVAALYAYDDNDGNDGEATLRGGADEVNQVLLDKLNERLEMAGLSVVEARINYLAYTPEIAAVMLRRQQATAIISAREKIVEGAVSMVKMALDKLSDEKIVELDSEQKARMVSNLLVVLCADESAQPVVNASGETK